MHTRRYALLRWRTYRISLSEFLEHLASYNGADMRIYNTLYTRKLSVHVLPPESLLEIFLYLCILQALLAVLPPISSLKVFLSNLLHRSFIVFPVLIIFYFTAFLKMSIMASVTCSMFISEESRSTASSACLSGEISLCISL